jgi:D-alanyl-lipoteichoic acid acyltransferase DltB (MBOAT superfamily)
MLFPTLAFLGFFLVVAALSAALDKHFLAKKLMLTVASFVFYAQWNWRFCFLLAGSTAVSYVAGLTIAGTEDQRKRRLTVGLAVAAHLGLLSFFKYRDFVTTQVNAGLASLGFGYELPFADIVLPIGISFFTFHGISYVVDVYRRDVEVCRRPADIALYMSFFPQLVSGPIVRAAYFLPQLAKPSGSGVPMAASLTLILFGLFKKMVMADYLAADLVDPVFAAPTNYGGADLMLATYGYAVQIYCDFSGYTDMAIGLAELLGFRFPLNFRQPYRSQSLQEFWRRWHISLSNWLRDYLYKPLGGSRGGPLKTYRNLIATMLLGGIWHGAQWKFVIWGALHGGGLAFERLTMPWTERWRALPIGKVIFTLLTFHFVCLCWIFFRAEDFDTATLFIQGIAGGWKLGMTQAGRFTVALIVLGLAFQFTPRGWLSGIVAALGRLPVWGQGAIAGVTLAFVEALCPPGVSPFIYFQF